MVPGRRHDYVLSIYPQSNGFAFALFEGVLAPLDWGIRQARGRDKNARCLSRVLALMVQYAPDVLVLQDVPRCGDRRDPRIHQLHHRIVELAGTCDIPTRLYPREKVREYFARLGATTKHAMAETIAKRIPALRLSVPPPRKIWSSQPAHLGIFEAAALAWMYFHEMLERSTKENSDAATIL